MHAVRNFGSKFGYIHSWIQNMKQSMIIKYTTAILFMIPKINQQNALVGLLKYLSHEDMYRAGTDKTRFHVTLEYTTNKTLQNRF